MFLSDPDVTLWHGDVLETLRELPAESVDCVVTSPPYWGLRDYGTGAWEGGDADCDHVRTVLHASRDSDRPKGWDGNFRNTSDPRPIGYASECGKCGATRIDQQLGLEPTPEQYVERMVEVFREVRRVLAAHGTVWLNLGDSYAGSGPTNHGGDSSTLNSDGRSEESRKRVVQGIADNLRRAGTKGTPVGGLKPKDLCMVPARLAMALQAPYYTGDIRKESARAWLAAVVDSEGCIYISRSKKGATTGRDRKYQRTQDAFDVGLSVVNTARELLDRCVEITGIGTVRESHNRGTQAYEWRLYSGKARKVLRELYPHLVSKQHQARLALGCPPSGDDASKAWESLKALHQGETPGIDFAPPESLFEGGWYLRSDIIWSKRPNPMPESVTDRPTKAHEYVFLFSKQPRYFFDQEAVRERWEEGWKGRLDGGTASSGRLDSRPDRGAFAAKGPDGRRKTSVQGADGSIQHRDGERWPNGGRNIRSVWEIATQPFSGAHFATFPEELCRRAIAAGCPEWVCRVCGKARERIIDKPQPPAEMRERKADKMAYHTRAVDGGGGKIAAWYAKNPPSTLGFTDCGHSDYRPGIVLDPFMGSGTVAHVARKLGRHSIGIDLSSEYLELAARRLQQQSLFAEVAS